MRNLLNKTNWKKNKPEPSLIHPYVMFWVQNQEKGSFQAWKEGALVFLLVSQSYHCSSSLQRDSSFLVAERSNLTKNHKCKF